MERGESEGRVGSAGRVEVLAVAKKGDPAVASDEAVNTISVSDVQSTRSG